MGRSTAYEPSLLGEAFTPGSRFGGRLKPFVDTLVDLCTAGERTVVVSRQVSRLKELWSERGIEPADGRSLPELIEGTLSEGWSLTLTASRAFT